MHINRPHFETLVEAMRATCSSHPENGFTFQNEHGSETTYTFPEIEAETARRVTGLQKFGLVQGDRIGLAVLEPEGFVLTFLAAIRIGIVPVPICPPLYMVNVDNYMRQVSSVLVSAGARVLVISERLLPTLRTLREKVATLEKIVTEGELKCDSLAENYPPILPEDVAFLQYTSGSTSEPRGVIVRHRSLMYNIEAFMGHGLRMDPQTDAGVSWLPLYHDMGLVGFVLGPIAWGISVTFIPTFRFIKNPAVWLEAVHRHRATVSFAPNFAFSLTAKRSRGNGAAWDLSCLKTLGCGAEPIVPSSMNRFLQVFGERCAIKKSCITPAYGMAECTLAITMKTLHQVMRTRFVDRNSFEKQGYAMAPVPGAPTIEHVSCGSPLGSTEIRILGADEQPLEDNREGEIYVRGPSLAAGYFGRADVWAGMNRNGWFRTGDLGYSSAGELYVTGRSKDLIILNGRNHHPHEIEWAVTEVNGVRDGCVAAFSRPGEFGEELVVAVETKSRAVESLVASVYNAIQNAICTSPSDVVCLPPGTIPKTSSGKLRRHQLRQRYLDTKLTEIRYPAV